MPRRPPQTDPTALAVALTGDLGLSRPAVSRLFAKRASWIRHDRSPAGALARRLGVRRAELRRARTLLPRLSELAEAHFERAAAEEWQIITQNDGSWPPRFDELHEPPAAIWCRADPAPEEGTEWLKRPAIAIVGSRRADPYGREAAEWFGRELAAAGMVVVSGFARGIDAAAHRGALSVTGGLTIAVLGCGLDVDYPYRQKKLKAEIARRGAVLTEYPPGTQPLGRNFPVRNRLIAALSHGVLVVQAAARSGSLITARLAMELGRDIYAVPGAIFRERALGPNALIRDGALPALHPRDIVESLPSCAREFLNALEGSTAEQGQVTAPTHPLLMHVEIGTPRPVETIAKAASIPTATALAALLELELAGAVRRHPGSAYSRTVGSKHHEPA